MSNCAQHHDYKGAIGYCPRCRIAELKTELAALSADYHGERLRADSLFDQLAALKKLARGFVEANTTIQYWHMKDEFRAALQEKGNE